MRLFFSFEQESIKVVINRIDSFSAFKSQKQTVENNSADERWHKHGLERHTLLKEKQNLSALKGDVWQIINWCLHQGQSLEVTVVSKFLDKKKKYLLTRLILRCIYIELMELQLGLNGYLLFWLRSDLA